jgi:hypothetical protein
MAETAFGRRVFPLQEKCQPKDEAWRQIQYTKFRVLSTRIEDIKSNPAAFAVELTAVQDELQELIRTTGLKGETCLTYLPYFNIHRDVIMVRMCSYRPRSQCIGQRCNPGAPDVLTHARTSRTRPIR